MIYGYDCANTMKKYLIIALSMAIGAGSVYAAYRLYTRAFRPSLYAQLISINDESGKKLTFRLTNLGSKNIVLDTDSMRMALLSLPGRPNVYMIYATSDRDGARAGTYGSGTTLAPQQSFMLPNIRPAIINVFSRRNITLKPIVLVSYESRHEGNGRYWQGNVKSFPLELDLADG